MKSRISGLMIVILLAGLAFQADAQTRSKTKNSSRKPTTTTRKTTAQKTNTKAVDSNLIVKAVDTTPPKMAEPPKPVLKLDTVKPSMRPTSSIVRENSKDRTPFDYEHIREDDATYVQIVWREIDIREKMNLSFGYKADEDEGNQRFISILLKAIQDGDVTAFDVGATTNDDRFTTPLTWARVSEALTGGVEYETVPDREKDPNGQLGLTKIVPIAKEFNPDAIVKYMIKEEWIFDKESSRMFTRINGIAPMKTVVAGGIEMEPVPAFWIYYPDLRPVLARKDVYNGRNAGGRMSWEELFEGRMFASTIVKSTIDNPNDLYFKQFLKDPILRLLEGESIKEKIFNFEQNLWSY